MIRTRWLAWTAIRLAATAAGCWTVQQIIEREGYRADLTNVAILAAVLLVVVRLWMPGKD